MARVKDLSPKLNLRPFSEELQIEDPMPVGQLIGGMYAGSRETKFGNFRIRGIDEQVFFGEDVEGFDTGVGIFMGKDASDGVYKFRAGDPDGTNVYWDGSSLNITGFLQVGEAASDVNAGVTDVEWTKITNVAIVNADIVNLAANKITSGDIASARMATNVLSALQANVDELSAITADVGTLTAGAMQGVTISIGSGNSIFKADSNGIYLGNATFGSAPFRVNPSGALVASSATITGAIQSGSTITGATITSTTITGGTVRTAASGARVELNGAGNELRVYSSGGSVLGYLANVSNSIKLGSSSGQLLLTAASQITVTGTDLYIEANNYLRTSYISSYSGGNIHFANHVQATSGDFTIEDDLQVDGNMKSDHFDPNSSNTYNQGSDSTYWNFIYADDFINKSLGWYDEGVTIIKDGKEQKVSDMEGLLNIRPDLNMKNKNGSPKLDRRTLPLEIYRQAIDRDTGEPYPRDEQDRPYIPEKLDKKGNVVEERQILTDSESLTHFVSVMFGAMKELHAEVEELKEELAIIGAKKE